MRERYLAGFLVATLLFAGGPAVAADDPRIAAKALYLTGTKHYNLSEFREALVAFRDAYRRVEDPVFLFNMGQCQRMLGDYDAAIFSYRAYLRAAPNARNQADVEARIAEMERAQRRRIEQGVPVGVIRADEVGPPWPPPAPVAPVARPTVEVAPPTGNVTKPPPPAAQRTPVYKKWWLWTAVAGVVVIAGGGVGLGLALSSPAGVPTTALGNVDLRK